VGNQAPHEKALERERQGTQEPVRRIEDSGLNIRLSREAAEVVRIPEWQLPKRECLTIESLPVVRLIHVIPDDQPPGRERCTE
jgi:hypothetical protein